MEINEKDIKKLAQEVAKTLFVLFNEQQSAEYCTTRQAAKILGISTDHMRKIKDKFPHIKNGGKDQGHILFLKSGLIEEYGK